MSQVALQEAVRRSINLNFGKWANKYGPKSLDQAVSTENYTPLGDLLAAKPAVDMSGEYDGVHTRLQLEFGDLSAPSLTMDAARLRVMAEQGRGWRSCLDRD